MRALGLHVEPFLVVREGRTESGDLAGQASWSVGFLTTGDVPELHRLEPEKSETLLAERFDSGHLCFGVKEGSRLIAKMWCDPNEFNYAPNWRRLAADEVYLYGAYADPSFRGVGLAPYMRMACYAALRGRGLTRFCSYTHVFNYPARRFKAKLGAEDEALRVSVRFGRRRGITLTLRSFATPDVRSSTHS